MRHDHPAGERALSEPAATSAPASLEQPLAQGFAALIAPGSLDPGARVEGLRAALRDIAEALAALHASGSLHLDLRPGAVLLDPAGKVTLLPSARAAPLDPPRTARDGPPLDAAFAPYQAPEIAEGQPPSPAADWYAFGALIFEALTGKPPIAEPWAPSVEPAFHGEPVDPRLLVPDLPDDLADLAVDLLRPSPLLRPTGATVLAALGAAPPSRSAALTAWEARVPFLDRTLELGSLDDALSTARAGAPVTALIHGCEGTGKTALVRRFLDRLHEQRRALIFEAPCRAGSSHPCEGIATLIDALADHLRALPEAEAEALLPPDASNLLPLFPALGQVPALARLPAFPAPPDPREQRRRAILALRAILGRVSEREPMVINVDGLEHATPEGASLLADLREPGDDPEAPSPPFLLLLAFRSERASTIDLIVTLRRRLARGETVGDLREVLVDPLSTRQARTLARLHLGPRAEPSLLAKIARESGGIPRRVLALCAAEGASIAVLPEPAAPPAEPARLSSPTARGTTGESAAQRASAARALLDEGQIAEGLRAAESLLASLDLPLASSHGRARLSLFFRRAQLSLRGLGTRAAPALDPAVQARLDAGRALARALDPFDPTRAVELHLRLLLLALRAGEPTRLAEAFAAEALRLARGDAAQGDRAQALLDRARDVVKGLDRPALHASLLAARAELALLTGRFGEAIEHAASAIALVRDHDDEASRAVASIERQALFPSLLARGDLHLFSHRVPLALHRAEALGPAYDAIALRTGLMARAHLLEDRPNEALADAEDALRTFAPRGFTTLHAAELLSRASAYLYESDAPRAHEALTRSWPALERSGSLEIQPIRVEAMTLRALSACAASRWSPHRDELLAAADRDGRLLAKESAPPARGAANLVHAIVCTYRGQRDRAVPLFQEAETSFARTGMKLHAAIASRRRGELLGGDEGRALLWSCDEWLVREGVRAPERVAAMIAPW
ncbi:MAG: AAA family ATPase [Byssovorax sp.]